MRQRRRLLRRWMLGYVAVLFVTLPLALPIWNGILRDSLGRVVTIEQIHLAQYGGLGWLAGVYARAGAYTGRTGALLLLLCAAIGLCDELVQGALPGRFFDWVDVRLNAMGSLAGMLGSSAFAWVRGLRGS